MSLVELVVYGALLAVISVFVVNTIVMATRVISEVRAERAITTNGELIMQKIIREARQATSLNASSTFNVDPGDLSLTTIVSPTDYTETTADFYTDAAGDVYYKKGSAASALLNSEDVSVSTIVFRKIFTATSSEGVRVELTLQATASARYVISRNFFGTAILRGSY
ncbi:MAG: hypothetical protein A3I44_00045 [Candidatus Sungbacteria bacterium RIFCSPLOWO2_02_FULL_51_17]|uniref:General secretion pathway GspH domain-containing protein n=1 Tax=Candidatus Sungbacteria bacterium RIFCSPHIGHO2_02_FULL_51_29 TaxID=1802273 RepID=A0A1G2KTQ3_9BACT|nr:MAG: hypothetical protein A2676_05480 [Candidatus Sungbacteria bacterium RIFCSPHIGHO2_01_FULL_51_22]OHA01769.1 MAG: hypothetical protein A3C16_02685 [Candidatus Sungbacteria bacterium RIFCSPHIGHO2_02_FULL_51_29]OHA11547.1 MAG: hypothetical protein A3I44_00045 [Candidatus Sungbacteria bacterium RIFCSPLOWO2_02_FULL_51_17]